MTFFRPSSIGSVSVPRSVKPYDTCLDISAFIVLNVRFLDTCLVVVSVLLSLRLIAQSHERVHWNGPSTSPLQPAPQPMPHYLCSGQPPRQARPDRAILLGAALLITDLPGLSSEFDLVAMAETNRWATIAVLRPLHHGVVAAWRRHPPLRELIELDCPETEWAAQLRKELAASGPPTPEEVVDYISSACPDPAFQRALLAELRRQSRPARSTRHYAYSRRGPLTANDWMGLYTVTRLLSLPGRPSTDDAAMMLDIDPRTLKDRCRRVLELDCRDVQKGFGWKWAVERALRLHGYVPDDPPLGLGFQTSYRVGPPRPKLRVS